MSSQTTSTTDLKWRSTPIKDQILKADSKWKKYADQLSKIDDEKIDELDSSDLQKYGINISDHRKQIYAIIQQIIVESKLLKSKQCTEIREYFLKKMRILLQNKTKQELKIQSGDENCLGFQDMKDEKTLNQHTIKDIRCDPLQRITLILEIYKKWANISSSSWKKIPITEVLTITEQYSHQQLVDDFLHIQLVHCHDVGHKLSSPKTLKQILCDKFMKEMKCEIKPCIPFERHYRERNAKNEQSLYHRQLSKISHSKSLRIINDKDIVFQQECDKIHSYFFHPPELYDIDDGKRHHDKIENTKKQTLYIGAKEDETWFRQITLNKGKKQTEKEIYRLLVEKMGAFRWQSAHGFRPGQNRAVAMLKPKYNNIKEEALYNNYQPLTKDNWNQTLRKSKIFYQSWAKDKMKTEYKGYFDDKVTGQSAKWEKGIEIILQDIVTLKLYTDFDRLQFALKKCFRFETIHDIIVENKDDIKNDDDIHDEERTLQTAAEDAQTRQDLEQRIKEFFHWRSGLMIILNKFGTKLNGKNNNMILYHGVNAKMIICPTQTFAFYGPLSTTTSEYVAKTFATAKGMVLKITSHFPRLNYCNAFNASLISDYPEEQEWLIGFMYVRVLQIRTRALINNATTSYVELLKKTSIASWIRQEFFAIHLFGEQMFSMNEHLERMLAQYLRVNRKECCENKEKYKDKYKDKYNNKDYDGDWSFHIEDLCLLCTKHRQNTGKEKDEFTKQVLNQLSMTEELSLDAERRLKVLPILWGKFNQFCEYPNLQQSIKFDEISDLFKRFFMEPSNEKDVVTNERKWVISFDEITTVYPNAKGIHFLNQYKFDNHVLRRLIKQIKRNHPPNKLEKVTFSYYNYPKTDINTPSNDHIYQNPHDLDKDMLLDLKEKLKWKIKQQTNGQTGHKITVYKF